MNAGDRRHGVRDSQARSQGVPGDPTRAEAGPSVRGPSRLGTEDKLEMPRKAAQVRPCPLSLARGHLTVLLSGGRQGRDRVGRGVGAPGETDGQLFCGGQGEVTGTQGVCPRQGNLGSKVGTED